MRLSESMSLNTVLRNTSSFLFGACGQTCIGRKQCDNWHNYRLRTRLKRRQTWLIFYITGFDKKEHKNKHSWSPWKLHGIYLNYCKINRYYCSIIEMLPVVWLCKINRSRVLDVCFVVCPSAAPQMAWTLVASLQSILTYCIIANCRPFWEGTLNLPYSSD